MTSERLLVRQCVSKLILLAIGCGAFVGAGVWIATSDPSSHRSGLAIPMAYLGIVFSGLCLLVCIQRLAVGPRIPVELSPKGFVDRRLFNSEVSWTSVRGIHVWSHKRTSLIAVQLTTDAMNNLDKTLFAKVKSRLNTPFGPNIVYVSTGDLDIQFKELLWHFQQYLKEHNPGSSIDR